MIMKLMVMMKIVIMMILTTAKNTKTRTVKDHCAKTACHLCPTVDSSRTPRGPPDLGRRLPPRLLPHRPYQLDLRPGPRHTTPPGARRQRRQQRRRRRAATGGGGGQQERSDPPAASGQSRVCCLGRPERMRLPRGLRGRGPGQRGGAVPLPVPAGAGRPEEAGEGQLGDAEAGRGCQAADQTEPEEPGREDVAIQDFHFLKCVVLGCLLR